jgi:hypothetical protein
MPLTATGQLKLSQIAAEFNDTAPNGMSEFYSAATGIPASGEITVSDFYGADGPGDGSGDGGGGAGDGGGGGGGGGGGTPVATGYYPIIASTGSNGNNNANINNIYYRRSIIHFVYTAAEIQAATAGTSGTISRLRFYVTQEPLYQPLPNYAIGIKSGTFSGNPGASGYTVVYSPSSQSFSINAYSYFNFTSGQTINWTGTDLAFAFAWGQSPTNWNGSGKTRIGSGTMYYSRSDSSGQYTINSNSSGSTASYRPVLELYFQ